MLPASAAHTTLLLPCGLILIPMPKPLPSMGCIAPSSMALTLNPGNLIVLGAAMAEPKPEPWTLLS
jgi:hypothetical protein